MPLILRTNLSRPLHHSELDHNFQLVQVKRWVYTDYEADQVVVFKSNNGPALLYICVTGHNRYIYDQNGGSFALTIGGTTLWELVGYPNAPTVVTGSTSVGDYDPAFVDSLAVPNSVGGIAAGTTVAQLRHKNYTEMFNQLLFPVINPTFTAPSVSLGATNIPGALAVAHTNINANLQTVASRGQIFQPWNNQFQNYRAGGVISYSYTVGGAPFIGDGTPLADLVTILKSVVIGSNPFSVTVSFGQGSQPVDNFGNNYSSPLLAESLTANYSVEGVLPILATTNLITVLDLQPLYSMQSANNIEITLAAESGTDKQQFALPNAWVQNRPLQQVLYFNNVANQYSTVNKITDFQTSTYPVTANSTTENYTLFAYTGPMRGSIKIKLVF